MMLIWNFLFADIITPTPPPNLNSFYPLAVNIC